MKVTVIKTFQGREFAKAEQEVVTLEDLIIFTQKLGYVQSIEDYVVDFQIFQPVIYRVGIEHGFGG